MMRKNNEAWWVPQDHDIDHLEATVPYEIKHKKRVKLHKTISAISIALTLGIIALAANIIITNKDITRIEDQGNQTLASTNAILAQCGNLFTFHNRMPEALSQASVFNPEELAQHNGKAYVPILKKVIVPPFGYMIDQRLDKNTKFYHTVEEIPLPQTLRSVYDGAIIVWYSPLTSEKEIEDIKQWVETQDNVIAIPWKNANIGVGQDIPPVLMPLNRSIAFTAWGLTQSCGIWSENAINDFIKFAQKLEKDQPRAVTPPQAKLTEDELLPPFTEQ